MYVCMDGWMDGWMVYLVSDDDEDDAAAVRGVRNLSSYKTFGYNNEYYWRQL